VLPVRLPDVSEGTADELTLEPALGGEMAGRL
jgi:hypothetical protein